MLPALVLGYLGALLAATLYARRRQGRSGDARRHFVAGSSLSATVVGCALAATSIAGSSLVVTTALVYQHGLAGIWVELAGALGFLVLGLGLARRVRESGVASIAELAGLRHGPAVRRGVALVVLLAELGWLALQAKAAATVLGAALPGLAGWQLSGGMLAVVVGYTLLGGQFAASYADVVQLVLIIVGFVVLAPAAALRALGGAAALRGLNWDFPTSATLGWPEVLGFLVLTGLPHVVGSDIYAKLLSARDGRAAARGAGLAAALKALFAAALALTALAAARLLPGLARPGEALTRLVLEVLPSGVAAVLVVAMLAVLQSTASQVLLSAVTMVGNDLWPRRRGVVPAATVGAGVVAFALAVAFPTVVDLMKVAYSIFAGGLALPVLAAVLPEVVLPRAAVGAAIVGGGLLGGGLHAARLAAGLATPVDPVLLGVGWSALCLALGALLARRGVARGGS